MISRGNFYSTLIKFNITPNEKLTASELLAILEVDAGRILYGPGEDGARLSRFVPNLNLEVGSIWEGKKLQSVSDRKNKKRYYFFVEI